MTRADLATSAQEWGIIAVGPTAMSLLESYRAARAWYEEALTQGDAEQLELARADLDRAVRLLAAAIDQCEVVTRELGA